MNIDYFTAQDLRRIGFTYQFWDQNPQKGMVFWYRGQEWVVGGRVLSKDIDIPEDVVKKGLWLPDSDYLLMWLSDNDFTIDIKYEGRYYAVAEDPYTHTRYKGAHDTLAFALSKVISKIYKKKERELDNRAYEKSTAEIIDDYIEPL